MDRLIKDFIIYAKEEFDLDIKPNELKKIIGNHTVMFKTFQIIMLKFKSKHNGEIIKKQLEIDEKKTKLNQLVNQLNLVQNDLLDVIKVIDNIKSTINKGSQFKKFYEFKLMRINQLIKLLEAILKSNEKEIDTESNLNRIDMLIELLNLKFNLDETDEHLLPSQINYNLLEKQIDEIMKEINGSIYEFVELMKNEDFVLELGDDFIENLTEIDFKVDTQADEINEKQVKDKLLIKLNKNFENYKERTDNLYNKHKDKVFDLIRKVEEQTSKK